MSFAPNRSILNPKFEGYKLSPVSELDAIHQFPLPGSGISQSTVSGGTHLAFQEVQSRVRQNHLAISVADPGIFAYIDKDFNFIIVAVEQRTLHVIFYQIWDIPRPIQPQTTNVAEYPVAMSLTKEKWLLSDGGGRLYLVLIEQLPNKVGCLASYEVVFGNSVIPLRLHAATIQEGSIIALISHRAPVVQATTPQPRATFNITAIRLHIPSDTTSLLHQIEVLWRKSGTDIPTLVAMQDSSWLVAAGSTFEDINTTLIRQDKTVLNEKEDQPTEPLPPPYSWTQSSESLTIAFPLPSNTPKAHIHVRIGPKHLSLLIKNDESSVIPLPKYTMKELWDKVDTTSSLWTWDKEGEKTVGLLTLHLEKLHEGTKWPHVFAKNDVENDDQDVPETIDPSEMWKIRETLEKYTTTIQSGEATSSSDGIPSLAKGEIDDSVDTEVGRRIAITWLDPVTGDETGPHTPHQELLAIPLPRFTTESNRLSLVIKNGIEGLLFASPRVPTVDTWEHVSTFPALAFVLASKRETRFVFHLEGAAVLALESGGRDAGPNMYIYHDAKGGIKARQGIVRLGGDGGWGSLLGVAGMPFGSGIALVCLREKQIVIVKDFL